MSEMKYIPLGRTGVYSSIMGLGAMTFGEQNTWKLGGLGLEESARLVKKAIDSGVNFFDTADVYDQGRSEVLLGKALKDSREQVLIASKVRGRTGKGVNETGLSRHHINIAIKKSLERLGTSWIDLYQFHSWDKHTPLEESIDAMQGLVDSGFVNYPGISNFSAWQMAKAQTICEERGYESYQSAQMNYSLLNRDIEHEIVPFTKQSGMTILSWSPLHGGVLTGKYSSLTKPPEGTRMGSRGFFFPPFDPEKATKVLETVKRIAEEQGATMAQVSIAWLIGKKVLVLVGARTEKQLEDNMGSLDVNLTPTQVEELDKVSSPGVMYPQWMIDRRPGDRDFSIIV
jgi:aryl-alcohol dehydrogenase-like predicted oxidoreductase